MTERTLHRSLGSGQMAMIAIGGAIGTGLFLGSGFAIGMAGPAVLVSYAIAGLVTLALMAALAEMTVAAPVTGGFGAFAETWLGPLAGTLVLYGYWLAVVLAVGAEISAVAIYMAWWFPQVPGVLWIAGFTAALVATNLAAVGWFGRIEYSFSAVKVAAIVLFLLLGGWFWATSGVGLANYRLAGGFAPNGAWGVWKAVLIAIFSYFSVEMIAIAAGEAAAPEQAIVRAFRATFARLALFYLGSLAIMLAVSPWTRAGTSESPFVTVMAATGVPYAAGVINAVVLVAALSAINSQLYAASRILWSLADAGDAPQALARLAANGSPRRAVLMSSGGAVLAAVVGAIAPARAFGAFVAISTALGLFVWMMIFVTHLAFRRRHGPGAFRVRWHPWPSLFGAGALAALLLTTPFTAEFRWTLAWGAPFLLLVAAAWFLRAKRRATVA